MGSAPPRQAEPRALRRASASFDIALRAVAAAPPVPLSVLVPPLVDGDRVGELELGEVIGAGGMGVVRRARDARLGRDVAIKLASPSWGGAAEPDLLLEREGRALRRLRHPGIVTLHRLGRHAGRPYLVLELLEGETLSARLWRGAIDRAEALGIAIDLCDALGHAHRLGIVHRDVKPANVFLAGGARVVLIDFGLAAAGPSTAARGTRGAGGVAGRAGTPPYMAPEQRRGEPIDPRADVYAVGVVLHELLLGCLPDGERPSAIASLPSSLAGVLTRALAPWPGRRHVDAAALAAALRGAIGASQPRRGGSVFPNVAGAPDRPHRGSRARTSTKRIESCHSRRARVRTAS